MHIHSNTIEETVGVWFVWVFLFRSSDSIELMVTSTLMVSTLRDKQTEESSSGRGSRIKRRICSLLHLGSCPFVRHLIWQTTAAPWPAPPACCKVTAGCFLPRPQQLPHPVAWLIFLKPAFSQISRLPFPLLISGAQQLRGLRWHPAPTLSRPLLLPLPSGCTTP